LVRAIIKLRVIDEHQTRHVFKLNAQTWRWPVRTTVYSVVYSGFAKAGRRSSTGHRAPHHARGLLGKLQPGEIKYNHVISRDQKHIATP
jgi:hypothetical protein